jgi:hypothetical protein
MRLEPATGLWRLRASLRNRYGGPDGRAGGRDPARRAELCPLR